MIKKIVLLIFLGIYCFCLNGQIYIEEKAIYDEAEEYLEGEEFEEALALFHLLEKRQIVNSNINFKIGLCYLNIEGQEARSIPYLQNAVQNITNSYSGNFEEFNAPEKAWLLLGKAYHIASDLENAKFCFNKISEITQDPDLIKLAEFYLSRTNVAEILLKNPVDANTEVLIDNSNFQIYNSQIVSDSEILLMERRKFYNALVSCQLDSNSLLLKDNITPMIGSDGNIFLCGASYNSDLLIYTGYNPGMGYDLYYSEKTSNNKWSKYKRFSEPINSAFNETSATLMGDTIYFTSNRKGSFGGLDIFVSIRSEQGIWSQPKNLGPTVNSIFDESSPIFSYEDKTLFFCSQGHLNMGGFDFFYSQRNQNNEWLPAVNMGSPFSTTSDEKFFSMETKNNAFYTTRYGLQNEEASTINKITLIGSLPAKRMVIKGNLEFSDSLVAKPVNFTIRNSDNTESTSKTRANGHYTLLLAPGNYTLTYRYNNKVTAEQSIYIDENQPADELVLSPPIWEYTDYQQSIRKDSSDKSNLESIVYLKDILFDFNSTTLDEKHYPMLDSLSQILKSNQKNNLLIIGHTDALGNEAYNLKLSKKRAEIVSAYLTKNNVDIEQLNIKGIGETNPVAMNYKENGEDSPEGRKYNRRVELQFTSKQNDLQVICIQLVTGNLKAK